MKLNQILNATEEQVAILDIVNIDFDKGVDVPVFIDMARVSEFFNSYSAINSTFQNINTIIRGTSLTNDKKIKLITKENNITNSLGLGFSKGQNKSSGKGPKKEPVIKMLGLIESIVNEEDRYKNIGLFKYVLVGLGKDGLSDIFANMNEKLILDQNILLMKKLEAAIKDESTVFDDAGDMHFVYDDPKPYILYKGVKRRLTHVDWTISENTSVYKEVEDLVNFTKTDDWQEKIHNETIRGQLQELIEYQLVPNDVTGWKKFVDNFNSLNSCVNIKQVNKLEKIEVTNTLSLARRLMTQGSKEAKKEPFYSEMIKTALNVAGIGFESENEISNEYTSGKIDLYIPSFNSLIKLKATEDDKKIEQYIQQLKSYGTDTKYKDAKLTLLVISSRQNNKKIENYLIKNNLDEGKDMDVILFSYNFKTSSKFTNKKKDEQSDAEKQAAELEKINNKAKLISIKV